MCNVARQLRAINAGFTLIEVSIVLVIIGLVVGGVLVGQDLIRAAYVRAQISQIERFNTAVNTFYGKYQGLPGDLNPTVAQANGFLSGGGAQGYGDGNGLLEGLCGQLVPIGWCIGPSGENVMFWVDLTSANGQNLNLVEGNFTYANWCPTCGTDQPPSILYPPAKIGRGNYVYTFSINGLNYYGVYIFGGLVGAGDPEGPNVPGFTVAEAFNIDRKVDDGVANAGRVLSLNLNPGGGGGIFWATNNTTDNASTCFNSTTGYYSTAVKVGAGMNCSLAFQFQAGD